jgi:cytidine deaminase
MNRVKNSIHKKIYLTPTQAKELCEQLDLAWQDFLFQLIEVIRKRAIKPLSNFQVGAIANSGNLYFGTSLDFINTSTAQCVHAEQSAISNAHTHGETKMDTIVVNVAPCGYCRQFMYEMADAGDVAIMFPPNQRTTLGKLLPHPFGSAELGHEGGMLIAPLQVLQLQENAVENPVVDAALKAACRSYSPYWRSYSGAAIQTKNGKIFSGSYLENAGQNPDLSPMQAALLQ